MPYWEDISSNIFFWNSNSSSNYIGDWSFSFCIIPNTFLISTAYTLSSFSVLKVDYIRVLKNGS